ncbi:MAG: hypothetical protein M1113_02705 [Candidatus Thermoplasmatota archaeon]|nr:hypothetical protein [Candidatus Thermoplasmatota archaeon]
MEKDYLEWLDWKPGILRAVYELGRNGIVNWDDISQKTGSSRDTITDYLVSMNIAEYSDDGSLKISQFGRELYEKLEDINYLFSKYIDIGGEESD